VPRRRRHEFLLYARIRAAMVVRRRRMTAVMVEATIMRGHIEAVAASVNALCNASGARHFGAERSEERTIHNHRR
jgi:hypothetical protein